MPLFHSIAHNDVHMIQNQFNKGKIYFGGKFRNYQNNTIFHVAAFRDSLECIEEIVDNNFIFEELLIRNYVGDTCFHIAAKSGSTRILKYFMSRSTRKFLEVENDFGFTPLEALNEEMKLISDDRGEDLARMKECHHILLNADDFDDYVSADNWPFACSYDEFMAKCDPDLKIFMGVFTEMIQEKVIEKLIS